MGIVNFDAIILSEPLKQPNALVIKLVPRLMFAVFEHRVAVVIPFFEENCGTIIASKIGLQCIFETPAKEHRRSSVSLLPAFLLEI